MDFLRELGENTPPSHYYGNRVRSLFVLAGVIMLATLPIFKDAIPVPAMTSIIGILLLVIIAGITNPKQNWIVLLDFITSTGGFLIFEYEAVTDYTTIWNGFFLTNQILALTFLYALYYSTKTLRGSLNRPKK